MEDLREKISLLRERIRASANDTALYRELSDLLFQAGKISAAVNILEKSLSSLETGQAGTSGRVFSIFDPRHLGQEGKWVFERGLEYADAFLYHDAVECFQRALELGWESFETHYCLAGAYKSLHASEEAEGHCRRSLELNPRFAPAYILLASLLKLSGRLSESVAACEKALTLDPDCQAALYDLACYHSLSGNAEAAIVAMEKALRKGFCDFDWLEKDPDLEGLRRNPQFQYLMNVYRSKTK